MAGSGERWFHSTFNCPFPHLPPPNLTPPTPPLYLTQWKLQLPSHQAIKGTKILLQQSLLIIFWEVQLRPMMILDSRSNLISFRFLSSDIRVDILGTNSLKWPNRVYVPTQPLLLVRHNDVLGKVLLMITLTITLTNLSCHMDIKLMYIILRICLDVVKA